VPGPSDTPPSAWQRYSHRRIWQLRSSYAMKKSILETKWHSSTRPCWIIYWGHLAGVSVAPEDYDASQFWSAPPVLKSKAISKLTQSGAKAIVARDIPAEFKTSGWQRVPNANYYVLIPSK
jgi:hypothetical protein